MAKLPEIRYGRPVQRLHSTKAAALPGQLRTIDAAVGAVRQGVSIIDKALETEARLDAGRRFQEAQRDYAQRRSDLVQEYHTTDKPLEGFHQELSTARREAFSGQMPKAGRTQKYYRPDTDAFETRAQADEQSVFIQLTESRSKLHLELSSNDLVNSVRENPDSALAAIEEFEVGLTNNGLGQETNRVYRAQHAQAIMTEAVSELLDAGDVAEAAALLETKAFDNVPQRARLALEEAVFKATFTSMDEYVQETANNLLIGQGDLAGLSAALLETEGQVAGLVNLTEEQASDLAKASQGELAFRYFQGQLIEGKVKVVNDALKTGEYSDILSPAQTKQLMAAMSSGRVGLNVKGTQVRLSREVSKIITAYDEGELMDESSLNQATAYLNQLEQSYYAAGKTEPDTSYYNLKEDLADAVKANAFQVATNANPPAASAALQGTYGDRSYEAVNKRKMIRDALAVHAAAVVTNPAQLHRQSGGEVAPVLPVSDPKHLESLASRFNQHDGWVTQGGAETGGPLEPGELTVLSETLNSMNTNDLLVYAQAVSATVGEDKAVVMFEQLFDDQNMNVVPVAARLAAFGLGGDATKILSGSATLQNADSNMKPADLRDVRAQIGEALRGAYGENYAMYNRTVDATVAHYTGTLIDPNNRGDFSHNPDLVTNSIKAVTGGILEVEGRSYVAPAPSVDSRQLKQWMAGFNANSLPALADSNGAAIPADQVRDQLYDGNMFTSSRFALVDAGSPGLYYIEDTRSAALGGTGGILWDADRPGQYATIRYNPSDTGRRAPTPQPQIRTFN